MTEHNASTETMQYAYPIWVEAKDRRPYRILRQQWMQHYQNEVGGPGALALALDSTDTHITAMVKGRRNVGDELADKLEQTFNLPPGAIDAHDPSGLVAHFPSWGQAKPARPTLAQALEVLAASLNELPDERRELAAQHLQTLARAPDSKKALEALLSTMGPSRQIASVETAAFAGKPKDDGLTTKPNITAGDFVKR